MRGQLRWASWALLLVALVVALSYGALDDGGPQTNLDRVRGLSATIACPQCNGQSVAESDVAIAREIRADIARRVDAGETDAQIRQVYIDRYGEWVSLNPSGSGVVGLVWVIPVVGAAAGLAILGVAYWRARATRADGKKATDEDRELVEHALGP